MANQVQCLHPVTIVNPMLPWLIGQYGNYTLFDGYTHHVRCRHSYAYFGNYSVFSHAKQFVTADNIDDAYVLDEKTGETWPVFLQVPCGHCDCCSARKMDAFSHRCLLETQCYDCLPWFTTLTYNPKHLPKTGVQVRDVQLFLKRFRIRLDRMGYTRDFRVVYVGEYGHNYHRPHYHLLIWNIKPDKDHKYFILLRALRRSWNNGFVYNKIVSPEYTAQHHGKPEKCFEYVAKYIDKGCEVPEGCNPVFLCQSTKEGGIGSPFIRRHASYLQTSLNKDFKFVDQFSGKVRRMQYNSYILDKLFPSYSHSVPYRFRNAIKNLCYSSSLIGHVYRFNDILDLRRQFGEHVPFLLFHHSSAPGEVKMASQFCPAFYSLQCFIIDKCIDYISSHQNIDFVKAHRLAALRTVFLWKLFDGIAPRDLQDKAYTWRRHRELSKQHEVL